MTAKSKVRSWSPLVNCGLVMRVALLDVGVLVAVQDHVHLGQRPGGVVLLLAVDRDAARRFGGGLEQQRAGAAGRVVDRLVLAGVLADADDLGQDAGHLGRACRTGPCSCRTRWRSAASGTRRRRRAGRRPRRGEPRKSRSLKIATSLESRSCISLPLPSFSSSLKSARSMTLRRSLASASLPMILLNRSPISVSPLSGEHVVERAALGHVDQAVGIGLGLVRDVLHEQQRQDVVLVLRGVHAAAQLVAALPQRAIQVRLLQRHVPPFLIVIASGQTSHNAVLGAVKQVSSKPIIIDISRKSQLSQLYRIDQLAGPRTIRLCADSASRAQWPVSACWQRYGPGPPRCANCQALLLIWLAKGVDVRGIVPTGRRQLLRRCSW